MCLGRWLFNYVAAPRQGERTVIEGDNIFALSSLAMALASLSVETAPGSGIDIIKWTTPYDKRHKRKYQGAKWVAFGTKCFYLGDNIPTRTFEARGRLGCIIGYGRLKSYKVLDVDGYHLLKAVRITLTRDVKVAPNEYPIKDEGVDVLTRNLSLTQELFGSVYLQGSENARLAFYKPDKKGKCPTCQKWLEKNATHIEQIEVRSPACKLGVPGISTHWGGAMCNWEGVKVALSSTQRPLREPQSWRRMNFLMQKMEKLIQVWIQSLLRIYLRLTLHYRHRKRRRDHHLQVVVIFHQVQRLQLRSEAGLGFGGKQLQLLLRHKMLLQLVLMRPMLQWDHPWSNKQRPRYLMQQGLRSDSIYGMS